MLVSLQSLPMDIPLQILMNLNIKFDKGWNYEPKDNTLIINLHNVTISKNDDYKDQIFIIFMHIYFGFLVNSSNNIKNTPPTFPKKLSFDFIDFFFLKKMFNIQ